ncbi:MAG: zinc-ribbon domain [Pseudomonadota bacterium]
MGHFVFALLHVLCLLFAAAGLLLTIPLHLIYAVVRSRGAAAARAEEAALQQQAELVRCPACREQVRWDAIKCKHCGSELTPLPAPPAPPPAGDSHSIALLVAGLFAVVVIVKACG